MCASMCACVCLQVARDEQDPVLEERLLHWHMANLEFANAACSEALSLRGWDQDDPYELQGPHILLPGMCVCLCVFTGLNEPRGTDTLLRPCELACMTAVLRVQAQPI